MRTKIQTLFIAFAMILVSSSLVMAQPNGSSPRGQQGPPDQPRIVDVLPDVTADQETKIDAFHLTMMQNITPLDAQLQVKEAELKALMASDAALNNKDAKLKEINEIKYKIELEHITFHDNVRGILTADQKTVFDQWTLNHDRGGHGRGYHGQMGHRGQRGMRGQPQNR